MGNNGDTDLEEEKEIDNKICSYERLFSYIDHSKEVGKLLSNSSRIFRNELYLGLNHKIHDKVFHDSGRVMPYESLDVLKKRKWIDDDDGENRRETIVSDPENDTVISLFLEEMKKKYMTFIISKEIIIIQEKHLMDLAVGKLVIEVREFFGGREKEETELLCDRTIQKLRAERCSNIVYLGELKGCGVSRHRVILFKLLCDIFKIPCCILRGFQYQFEEKIPYSWNEVVFSNRTILVDSAMKYSHHHLVDIGLPQRKRNLQKMTIENVKKRYLIEEKGDDVLRIRNSLGEGGYGRVYEILDVEVLEDDDFKIVRKSLAVKEVDLSYVEDCTDPQERKKYERILRREVGIMNTMFQHPNIAKVYGSFTMTENKDTTTIMRIVMEKYDMNGYDFLRRLARRIHPSEILIFLLDIASGVEYIHSFGVIHFDLKPKNILLNWDEKKKCVTDVVVTDFGSSKYENMNLNVTTSPSITRRFSAPEIRRMIHKREGGMKIETTFTAKSDIYSFGVLWGVYMKYLEKTYISELEVIQKKCLSESPEERPSINEIKIAILRCLKNERNKSYLNFIRKPDDILENSLRISTLRRKLKNTRIKHLTNLERSEERMGIFGKLVFRCKIEGVTFVFGGIRKFTTSLISN